MFYSHDLLRLGDGTFSIVWLLGAKVNCQRKYSGKSRMKAIENNLKLKASLILSTNISQICEDLGRRLPVSERDHLSLRTTSVLLIGTVECHLQQVNLPKSETTKAIEKELIMTSLL